VFVYCLLIFDGWQLYLWTKKEKILDHIDIRIFSVSGSHAGAVIGNGEVWMWGEGEYGALVTA
jgi:hypothetical protein